MRYFRAESYLQGHCHRASSPMVLTEGLCVSSLEGCRFGVKKDPCGENEEIR